MTIAIGNLVYSLGSEPCSGTGREWTEKELDAALSGPVTRNLFDDAGRADIEEMFAELTDTNFAQDALRRIFSKPNKIEDWRVGEAIADIYLTDHRDCYFPWPVGRDERKSGSSLPGADLVGLGTDSRGDDCLVFGEVKTSSEARYPPSAMYGRTGLKQQLEDLRDQETIRDGLLRYLGHRAINAGWRQRFVGASKRFFNNSSDIQLYGVLVRDVQPNKDDLRVRVQKLATNCPNGTRIELLALYLPMGRITGIGSAALAPPAESSP